jgi:hypothetical protein
MRLRRWIMPSRIELCFVVLLIPASTAASVLAFSLEPTSRSNVEVE